MKILITGGTGFIGQNLIQHLLPDNELTIVTRNKSKAKKQLPEIVNILELDPNKPHEFINEISKVQVIINLAGDTIAGSKWTRRKRESILMSRVQVGQLITDMIKQSSVKPKLLIQASAIGYYGFNTTETLDESFENGSGFLADVCKQWENSTLEIENYGIKRAIIRIGVVIGNGGMLEKLSLPIKYFLGSQLGSGKNYTSWIHITDLVRSINHILNKELEGIYNLTTPNPITSKELNKTIARRLKRPIWMFIPKFMIQLIFGKTMANELILANQFVVPKNLEKEGFKFKYPHIMQAVKSIL